MLYWKLPCVPIMVSSAYAWNSASHGAGSPRALTVLYRSTSVISAWAKTAHDQAQEGSESVHGCWVQAVLLHAIRLQAGLPIYAAFNIYT